MSTITEIQRTFTVRHNTFML